MTNFTLRKGNLYNHLDNRIDKKIIDSNQYDLELQINNKKEYYRIRLNGDRFEAWSINISEKEFFLPRFSSFCKVSELESFRSTEFYKYYFRYYNLFEKRLSINRKNNYEELSEYYQYLLRINDKNNLSSEKVYDFSLPTVNKREKQGILSYDISIESVRKRYYLIFIKELAQKGFLQSNQLLYMIYDKKEFLKKQEKQEEKVIDICYQYDYPIGLTEFFYVITGGDIDLINSLHQQFLFARNKKDMNILLKSDVYKILKSSINYNPFLEKEILNYIYGKQEDINYQFKKTLK